MGATESRPLSSGASGAPKSGYHVVRIAANSPAAAAGLEPFFDFCVGIDGVALADPAAGDAGEKAPADAGKEAALEAWRNLERREGTQVVLNVWSSKRADLRDVPIVPSRDWSPPSSQPSLLGLSLRHCDPSRALSHVWHILDILDGSPAASAGLVPFGDYVIAWAGGVLGAGGEGDFYDLVESHKDKALRLFVYNSDLDCTREVILVPNREWGGEGLLGCGVGYGLLHRIPKPQDHIPDDSYFPTGHGSSSNPDGRGAAIDPPSRRTGRSQPPVLEEEEEGDEDEDEEGPTKTGVTISMRADEE